MTSSARPAWNQAAPHSGSSRTTPPELAHAQELFKGVDLPAFVTGAMAFMKSHAKKGDPPSLPVPSGKPEDVKITGDTAVAMLSGKEVKFARISSRWFIRLE